MAGITFQPAILVLLAFDVLTFYFSDWSFLLFQILKTLTLLGLKILIPTYFTKSHDKRGFLTSVWFGVGSVELLASSFTC